MFKIDAWLLFAISLITAIIFVLAQLFVAFYTLYTITMLLYIDMFQHITLSSMQYRKIVITGRALHKTIPFEQWYNTWKFDFRNVDRYFFLGTII